MKIEVIMKTSSNTTKIKWYIIILAKQMANSKNSGRVPKWLVTEATQNPKIDLQLNVMVILKLVNNNFYPSEITNNDRLR